MNFKPLVRPFPDVQSSPAGSQNYYFLSSGTSIRAPLRTFQTSMQFAPIYCVRLPLSPSPCSLKVGLDTSEVKVKLPGCKGPARVESVETDRGKAGCEPPFSQEPGFHPDSTNSFSDRAMPRSWSQHDLNLGVKSGRTTGDRQVTDR